MPLTVWLDVFASRPQNTVTTELLFASQEDIKQLSQFVKQLIMPQLKLMGSGQQVNWVHTSVHNRCHIFQSLPLCPCTRIVSLHLLENKTYKMCSNLCRKCERILYRKSYDDDWKVVCFFSLM